MRLQKYLALCGIGSRRKCEEIIAGGHVTVNGETITKMGVTIDETSDNICVDGISVKPEATLRYIVYYKPVSEMVTVSDPQGRRTVMDTFKGVITERIFPVGRLDYDTEGLLLLTNDGALMQKLTHPSNEVSKTYVARVRGIPDSKAVSRLSDGVVLPDGVITSKAAVRLFPRGLFCDVEITIHEGRNRQVRHMLEAVGHPVVGLKRVALYGLNLKGLSPGLWRELTPGEVEMLRDR